MKTDGSTTFAQHHFMVGYANLAEVIATSFFTILVFGFYMAHYAWSTGFFTSAFTPVLAVLFFASVLYVIVNTSAKAITPRKDILALIQLVGSPLRCGSSMDLRSLSPQLQPRGGCHSDTVSVSTLLADQRHWTNTSCTSAACCGHRFRSRCRKTSLASRRTTGPHRPQRFTEHLTKKPR